VKKIKVALIGGGTWGMAHAQIYSSHHLSEFVAVCDISQEKAKKIAKKYNVKYYIDYEEMLDNVDCDAVAIVTPDFAHAKPVVAAAKRNKHILCEKPLATSYEDIKLILDAVKGKDIKLMVDYHNRWNPPVCKIKSDVDAGKIGKVVSAYMRLNDIIYVPTEMLPWAEKSSILWFLGSHTVDVLNWIIGAKVERVFSVSYEGILKSRGINVPDLYQTILEYENGTVATMENSWILPNTNPYVNDYKLNITGEKGMFNMDFSHNTLLERFLECESSHPDVLVKPIIHGKPMGLAYESIRDFIEKVYYKKDLLISLEESVEITNVILAVLESAKKREPVKVKY
jgi:Predicted dehydrogenases and related proteins